MKASVTAATAAAKRNRRLLYLMILQVVLLICVGVVLASLYFRLSHDGRLIHKIPGPKGVPIFGNMFDICLRPDLWRNATCRGVQPRSTTSFRMCVRNIYAQAETETPSLYGRRALLLLETLFTFVRSMHRNHGNISKIQSFYFSAVNVYEPADLEVVLSATKFNEKRLPYKFLVPWLGQGLLVNNGEKWYHRRKLLTPAFHFNILKKFARTFSEQTVEFVESIHEETVKEKTEVLPLIMKHTLRIMCETSMGTTMDEDIRSVSNKYFTALYVLGKCVVHRLTSVWLYFDLPFAMTRVAYIQKTALRDLHRFTKQIIQERREYRQSNNIVDMIEDDEIYGRKSRLAMLDLLLDQEKKGRIDDDGIREEVDTFMFEGHDTTASGLCFLMMRIANEPDIQENIYQELSCIFGDSDRDPTMEDLSNMKYLECCIKEALRLYPSVPFIARHFTEEVVLSGYRVPAGTVCNIHIYDLHRRPDLYPDPERFIPERFLQHNIAKRHPYAYIPFSAGPRNCIGQKFATLEMKTLMSGVLRKFRLEPVTKPEDCQFICDLVLRTKNPIYVRFRNRRKYN